MKTKNNRLKIPIWVRFENYCRGSGLLVPVCWCLFVVFAVVEGSGGASLPRMPYVQALR